jgi:hypothetical protein
MKGRQTGRFGDVHVNRDGSALVVTLLIMVSLTIIGVVSINTSVVEIHIDRNERQMNEAFYLAEGGAREGIQRLVSMAARDLAEQHAPWHHAMEEVDRDGMDFRQPGNWVVDGDGEDNALPCSWSEDTYLAAVEWSVATGGSLILTDTRLYQNRIYSLCTRHDTGMLVEIGYYLRY